MSNKIIINEDSPLWEVLQTAEMLRDSQSEYYYLPYWFEKKGNEYVLHHTANLPDSLLNLIMDHR